MRAASTVVAAAVRRFVTSACVLWLAACSSSDVSARNGAPATGGAGTVATGAGGSAGIMGATGTTSTGGDGATSSGSTSSGATGAGGSIIITQPTSGDDAGLAPD